MFIVSYTSYLLFFSVITWYGLWVMHRSEHRKNLVEIDDPIYHIIPLCDTSIPVFSLLWIGSSVFFYLYEQWDWMHGAWSFMLLMIFRSIVLYLHPFKGHDSMIPLVDPITEFFVRTRQPFRNDLSFSGHVSTLVLFGLLLPSEYKVYYWWGAFVTGWLLILSRVHYTADVFIAPMFSYFCYHLAATLYPLWYLYGNVPAAFAISFILLGLTLIDLKKKRKE